MVNIKHETISDAFEMVAMVAMAIVAIIPFGIVVCGVMCEEAYAEMKHKKSARRWLKEHTTHD